MRPLALAATLLATLACASSSGAGGDPPRAAARASEDVKVLKVSPQCGGTAGVTWIGAPDVYASAMRELGRESLTGAAEAPPAVDFTKYGVVRVSMGTRTTGGYAVALAEPAFTREGSTGLLRVTWSEPPKDSMNAQVMTSPCLVVAVPREGLREVRVVDQGGTERGRVEVR
jgi:hypothetical protein